MDAQRERLKRHIEDRAVELRLRLKDVANAAGMSIANLHRVRNGIGTLTPYAMAALEDALEWAPGSVRAVLDGDAPTPRQVATAAPDVEPPPAGLDVDPARWAAWDPLDRQNIINAYKLAEQRRYLAQQRRGTRATPEQQRRSAG
jgi:AraC-like DNA-binding protein